MKKEGKVEKFITRIVLGILFLFFMLILACAIAVKAGAKNLFKMDHRIETKIYEIRSDDSLLNKVKKSYSNGVFAVKNYADAYANDLLIGRRMIVENEVRYKNLIGWKIFAPGEYNSLLYLDDGYLASANPKETKEGVQKIATKIKGLADVSAYSGAAFFYVQTPGNVDKYGDKEINNVKDYANYNADLLVGNLKTYGIDCLDLRENIHETFEDYRSLFFKTDHHWRQPVALWATGELCQYLHEQCGFTYDEKYYDAENYITEVKEAHYLGSLGRKATLAETKPDDFELLHPKFDTNMKLTQDKKGPEKKPYLREGRWEMLYDMYQMDYEDIYWRECYLALLSFYGTGKVTVENLDADEDTHIVFVADSLCIPVTSFLALNAKKVELIDARYYDDSIKGYIMETRPDIVICSYSTTIIQDYYPIFDFD